MEGDMTEQLIWLLAFGAFIYVAFVVFIDPWNQ
jgi:hypothetical protein